MSVIVLIIVVVFAILFFVLLNCLYKHTNSYINSRLDIQQFDKYQGELFDIVNLGSTYSKYAFGAAKDMKLNHGDFSLQSQSLEMDEKILFEHVDKIAENGVVVVVVAAACLLLHREKSDNLLYADIIKKCPFSLRLKSIFNKLFPLALHPKRFVKILFDEMYKRDVYDNYTSSLNNEESENELASLNEVWKELFGLRDLKQVKLSDENRNIINQNIEHIHNIILICEKHKLRPIVVIPPFSERLNKYFSIEFKEHIINESINKAVEGRNVPFFDYQYDEYFQKRYQLFVDGGFRLNKKGSTVFLKKLFADLKLHNIVINNGTAGV